MPLLLKLPTVDGDFRDEWQVTGTAPSWGCDYAFCHVTLIGMMPPQLRPNGNMCFQIVSGQGYFFQAELADGQVVGWTGQVLRNSTPTYVPRYLPFFVLARGEEPLVMSVICTTVQAAHADRELVPLETLQNVTIQLQVEVVGCDENGTWTVRTEEGEELPIEDPEHRLGFAVGATINLNLELNFSDLIGTNQAPPAP